MDSNINFIMDSIIDFIGLNYEFRNGVHRRLSLWIPSSTLLWTLPLQYSSFHTLKRQLSVCLSFRFSFVLLCHPFLVISGSGFLFAHCVYPPYLSRDLVVTIGFSRLHSINQSILEALLCNAPFVAFQHLCCMHLANHAIIIDDVMLVDIMTYLMTYSMTSCLMTSCSTKKIHSLDD